MLMLKLTAPSSLKREVAFSFLMVYIMCLLTSNSLIHFDSNNYVSGIGIHYYLYFLLFFCFTAALMLSLCVESVNFVGGLFL